MDTLYSTRIQYFPYWFRNVSILRLKCTIKLFYEILWFLLNHKKGSKFELMRSYREHQENQGYDTLFINGFLESTTEKMILDAIINDFVQTTTTSPKKSKSDLSQIDTIMNFYRKDDAPLLFIFINNIESGGLSKSFYTLSKLVALDKIKLICSVDKVGFEA